MVDLKKQYLKIKDQVDSSIKEVIESTAFINGDAVKNFSENLRNYLNAKYVITCGNGTDALQIAVMSLNLSPGDEIIVPAFTYVATAEVVALLNLKPVMIDVDYRTFNIDVNKIEQAICEKTKAIVPVHLFGQAANMEEINKIAAKNNLVVIEDNAQAIGADYTFSDGKTKKTGLLGDIGCTSFFPSKNLGCFGDGGAVFTNNDDLGRKMKMIANHGQNKKYHHKLIGINSRLDSIQAAVLDVKLKYLDQYNDLRFNAAKKYSERLKDIEQIKIPYLSEFSNHVFHQYTIIVENNKRNDLKKYLNKKGIAANIYYPLPLNEQLAFKNIAKVKGSIDNTYQLCKKVLSLPMHTELTEKNIDFICSSIKTFFDF